VLTLAVIPIAAPGHAAVRRRVDVRYERVDTTKSRPVETEVTFLTGQELNEKTRSFRYHSFSTYALIWFANDEVAIVEMKMFLPPIGPFGANDFRDAFSLGMELNGTQANSPQPRKWYFQAKRWLDWIDPRVEGR
jgi:hypothetical protein